jgi:hypothetical protein
MRGSTIHPHDAARRNLQSGFLECLTHNGFRWLLARFDAPAGKRPNPIIAPTMENNFIAHGANHSRDCCHHDQVVTDLGAQFTDKSRRWHTNNLINSDYLD